MAQRIQAGLDSQVEGTRAKLAGARTRLDIAQTQAAADQLRLRLSQLTGLPVAAIKTSTETIPEMPPVAQDQDLPGEAVKNSPVVKVADAAAQAKEFRAQAERKQLYPSVDFVGQYADAGAVQQLRRIFPEIPTQQRDCRRGHPLSIFQSGAAAPRRTQPKRMQ